MCTLVYLYVSGKGQEHITVWYVQDEFLRRQEWLVVNVYVFTLS